MTDLKEVYERTIKEEKTFILIEEMFSNGIKEIDKPIQRLKALIMVHKTDYFPEGAVKTPLETLKTCAKVVSCIVDGEEKECYNIL